MERPRSPRRLEQASDRDDGSGEISHGADLADQKHQVISEPAIVDLVDGRDGTSPRSVR